MEGQATISSAGLLGGVLYRSIWQTILLKSTQCWTGLAWVPVAWFCDMICVEFDSMTLDEADRIIWAVSLASCLLNPSPYS